MKYLIVGLGNIGAEYVLTRHNIGFMVLDHLIKNYEVEFQHAKYANVAIIKHKGRSIHLVKPTTYMNLSGKAVNYWLQEYRISKENLLVVTDDLALNVGQLRLRAKGSNVGHNGLKSIEEKTGGNNFARLKFGIGSDFFKGQQADYVLSNFKNDEISIINEKIDKATEMILSFCTVGIQMTMGNYNE